MKRDLVKYILIVICLAMVGFNLQAQTTVKPDARYKLIREHYTVKRDGTTEYNYRKELTLLRNRAITAYADKGETFIVYNPAFQSLTVNECYTIRKDGSRVKTPKNAFVEQLPAECENCGRLNGLVELAIVHTALEYDCTIVLDYTISSKSDIVQGKIQMTQDCPVDKYEIIVDGPYDMEMLYRLEKGDANVKTMDDIHKLHIVGSNLKQTSGDRYLPAAEKMYPTVWFSNRVSVNEAMKQVRGQLVEAIPLINSERVRIKKLGNLPEHKRNMLLAESLRDYVADNIRCNHLTPAQMNYKSVEAAEVWQSGCGTPFEKAKCLAALLQQAGFYAYVTLNEEEILTSDSKRFAMTGSGEATVTAVVDNTKIILSATSSHKASKPSTKATSTLTDEFEIVTIPSEDCPLDIDPAYLSSKRTTPVQAAFCDQKYAYDINVTAGATLVKPVEVRYSVEGLGEINISIKQKGEKLEVLKQLTITKEIIDEEHYADFRRMMIDWNRYNTIYLKRK